LANIYLHALDATWEKRGYSRREGPNVQMVRYADDLVLLTDGDADWALSRLREILDRLDLELNEQKSRVVDSEKETFDFLGSTFRRDWNRSRTKLVTLYSPSKKAQKRLRGKVKKVLSANIPVSVTEQIRRTNYLVRGWVNYFRVGNSGAALINIRWYVEMRLRRVLRRRRHQSGYGWTCYDHVYLYRRLGLYNDYRVRWQYSRS
jgi:RNA-directed DNA polymerase